MKSYHKSSCYKWDPSKSIQSLFPFPQFRINQIEFELKERKKSPWSPFLLFVHRERERERETSCVSWKLPHWRFLRGSILDPSNQWDTHRKPIWVLLRQKWWKHKKKTQNFAHNQIENNPDPSVPCRLLLASETGPQITPGTARA